MIDEMDVVDRLAKAEAGAHTASLKADRLTVLMMDMINTFQQYLDVAQRAYGPPRESHRRKDVIDIDIRLRGLFDEAQKSLEES